MQGFIITRSTLYHKILSPCWSVGRECYASLMCMQIARSWYASLQYSTWHNAGQSLFLKYFILQDYRCFYKSRHFAYQNSPGIILRHFFYRSSVLWAFLFTLFYSWPASCTIRNGVMQSLVVAQSNFCYKNNVALINRTTRKYKI